MMGPKASEAPSCDLCLDVHTTTSKMGTCLMMAREDDLAVRSTTAWLGLGLGCRGRFARPHLTPASTHPLTHPSPPSPPLSPQIELAAHLQRRLPAIRIVFWAKQRDEQPTLPTVARSGMTVEVGYLPQPWP